MTEAVKPFLTTVPEIAAVQIWSQLFYLSEDASFVPCNIKSQQLSGDYNELNFVWF